MPTPPSLDELTPTTEAELARLIAENAGGPRRALFPVGGRTALLGVPASEADGLYVKTLGLDAVVDYPARDMTITVGAGVRVDELARVLADEGQRLPVDVPQSQRATLGGVIATNTSGPRRFGLGTIRDHVIGIAAVDGRGRLFHAGGRVVKNVAGYDLCKLLVGSVGTLAVITSVTLKLSPTPATTALAWVPCPHFEAAEEALVRLTTSSTRPVVLDLFDPRAAAEIAAAGSRELPGDTPVLVVGFEGSEVETAWQRETLTTELGELGLEPMHVDDSRAVGLLETMIGFQTRSDDSLTFKANTQPSRTVALVRQASEAGCRVQSHAGNGIVYGHVADAVSHARDAAVLLEELRASVRPDGNLVVHDCDPDWQADLPMWGAVDPSRALMERLRSTFDPHGVLNPGRFPPVTSEA